MYRLECGVRRHWCVLSTQPYCGLQEPPLPVSADSLGTHSLLVYLSLGTLLECLCHKTANLYGTDSEGRLSKRRHLWGTMVKVMGVLPSLVCFQIVLCLCPIFLNGLHSLGPRSLSVSQQLIFPQPRKNSIQPRVG